MEVKIEQKTAMEQMAKLDEQNVYFEEDFEGKIGVKLRQKCKKLMKIHKHLHCSAKFQRICDFFGIFAECKLMRNQSCVFLFIWNLKHAVHESE